MHGSSAAIHIAARGRRVIVLDKGVGGRHSSASNAGGVRRLWRHPDELPLACEAASMWNHIEEIVGDNCGYRQSGHLKIAENKTDIAKLEDRLTTMKQLGFDHEELIDRDELRKWAPEVASHCAGALLCREDGFASPFRTTSAFQNKAVSNGAELALNQAVAGIDKKAGSWIIQTQDHLFEAPILLNCAGAWGDKIAEMIGDTVPLSAVAPTMMVTPPMPRFLEPVVGAVSRKLSFKQAPNGIVLIGGGYRGKLDRDTGFTQVDYSALKLSAQTVIDLFPIMKNAQVVRAWSGIEGQTPDSLPVIGQGLSDANAYHAFGFSSHGFQLAPVVGKLMAELIYDGASSLPIEPFSPARFHDVEIRNPETAQLSA